MPALAVSSPFPIYPDIDGKSLDNGSIYIGVAGLPAALNPITVYFDEALTQVATQPIATRGGYPVNNGVRCRLFVNSDYSIQVLNSNGTMVYEALNSADLAGVVPVTNGGTGNSSWTSNGLLYASNTTTLTNSANLTFDGSVLSFNTGGKVLLGATASSLAAGLQTFGSTNTANVNFKRYSNDAIGPTIAIFKTRDTTTSGFASVQANDQIGSIAFVGSQGTSAATLAVMDAYVDPTGTVSATSLPGMLTWATVPDGSLGVGSERMRLNNAGNLAIGTTSPTVRLTVNGGFALRSPSTVNAATYSVADLDYSLRFTTTNCTVTLPGAGSYPGRILVMNTITANSVTSNASNVIPLGSNTPGTAIFAATAGKFAMLQSDGTNWVVMMSN